MVVERFPDFFQWIGPGSLIFLGILIAASLLGLFVGYVVAVFRHGPFEAFYVVAQVIGDAVPDFLGMSLRRLIAIARLTAKEALRRRVLLVTFAIFAAMLLFGGWFLNSASEHPDRIYVNFVMWGTQMLVLLMGMLVSAFSLPEDIKNKTIYTVVTKPVRSSEVVLGRIMGLGAVCTALLALMAVISFFFVWRGLSHDHQLVGDTQTLASFVEVDLGTRKSRFSGRRVSENAVMEAQTTRNSGHSHRLELVEDIRDADSPPLVASNVVDSEELPNGRIKYRRIVCQPVGGHTHPVTVVGEGDDARIQLGSSVGYFRARVPIYADSLRFRDRAGDMKDRGTNVGNEWGYRGYIDGGSAGSQTSLARGLFRFSGLRESRFRRTEVIPLDMSLGVFRTYKADVEKRVMAGLQFESIPDNPEVDNRFVSDMITFETNEYTLQTLPIPRKLVGKLIGPDGSIVEQGEYDLFDDYAKNGDLLLSLSCRDPGQFLGVARADIYFRAGDTLYWLNFFKGYVGIWCQLMIIIAMGVAFSTFLNTPVTMLGIVVMAILGFYSSFVRELTQPDTVGGGPIESFIRVITQQNMQVSLETGFLTTVMEQADNLLVWLLAGLTYLAPDFSQLDFSDFLTYGYSIDPQRLIVALVITAAFVAGLTILGYFALKTREIAK